MNLCSDTALLRLVLLLSVFKSFNANHHYTDVHQLNQDGFSGGWPLGIEDGRLHGDKPFDQNDFQILDNLAPMLPGEINPWPYETNPYWKFDGCYRINAVSKTNPNISALASSWGNGCLEDDGGGRSIPWCPNHDSHYEYFQLKIKQGPTRISRFHVKGKPGEGHLKTFVVMTSLHPLDSEFFYYTERDKVVLFHAYNASEHTFSLKNTTLRFFRIVPVSWVGKIRVQLELTKCFECGDGFTDQADEECDDGNTLDLDGCSGRKSHIYGLPRGCMEETNNGAYWCEPRTDGSVRGNVLDDCVMKRTVVDKVQTRHQAQFQYDNRGPIGHISSNGFNSGILPLCDGESCDGQDPFG
jgi:cysteine-rich repeat protein